MVVHIYAQELQGLLAALKLDVKRNFTSYVVCPTCDCVYDYTSCYEVSGGKKVSKRCEYVAFPNHPHARQRQPCGALLLKKVKTRGKRMELVPRKTFPYQSLHSAITTMVSNPQFLEKCELWRKRSQAIPSDLLADVYDGDVWKNFNTEEYGTFLRFPGNLLLSLNVDWFQPFTHTQYSVGAMYLVVLNLPREERYRLENIILVGVIPGPKEPKLTINSYIAP